MLPILRPLDNPVLTRELRRRMRGKGLIWTLIGYVFGVCTIAFWVVFLNEPSGGVRSISTSASIVGSGLYGVVIAAQTLLVFFVAPGVAASVIQRERKGETFDFLRATTISPSSYVWGVFLSSMMYVTMVLLCGLPVLQIAYLYGGVSNIWSTSLFLLCLSTVMVSLGMLTGVMSTDKKRNIGALLAPVVLIIYAIPLFAQFVIRGMGNVSSLPTVSIGSFVVSLDVVLQFCFLIVAFGFMIGAKRKIFSAEARIFNYRQWFVILLFLYAVATMFTTMMPSSMGSSLVTIGSTAGFGAVLGSMWFLALLIPTIMTSSCLLAEPLTGSDLWRLRKRFPVLQRRPESPIVCVMFFAVSALLFWCMGYAIGLPSDQLAGFALPCLGYGMTLVTVTEYWQRRWRPVTTRKTKPHVIYALIMLVILPLVALWIESLDPQSPMPTFISAIAPFVPRDPNHPALMTAQWCAFLIHVTVALLLTIKIARLPAYHRLDAVDFAVPLPKK